MTKPVTVRSRTRKTRWTVRLADRVARGLITVGGIGTIIAVSTICVFLVWVVVPLFLPARLEVDRSLGGIRDDRSPAEVAGAVTGAGGSWSAGPPRVALDGSQTLGWAWFPDGRLDLFRLDDGKQLRSTQPTGGALPTAASFASPGGQVVLGFADGTARRGRIRFRTAFLPPADVPTEFAAMGPDEASEWHGGILRPTPDGNFRHEFLDVQLDDPRAVGTTPIELIDQSTRAGGPVVASLSANNELALLVLSVRRNLLSGKTTVQERKYQVPFTPREHGEKPIRLLVSGLGDSLYLAYADGLLLRYDIRSPSKAALRETARLVESGETLTALEFLAGRTTLLAGDSSGRVNAWFPIKPKDARTADGVMLARARQWPATGAPVRAIAPSERGRLAAVLDAGGYARIVQATTGQVLATTHLPPPVSASAPSTAPGTKPNEVALALAPKDDGLLVCRLDAIIPCRLDLGHPEITVRSLLTPIWYEGYSKPEFVWQSSGGGDDFEPKFSLFPLIFGTIKATVYSMLFAVPLALLAAIHTSEFLSSRAKARVKPAIELMASLPSVVLGFLAAIVFAPFVERGISVVLCGFFSIPLTLLGGAYLWQFLPRGWVVREARFRLLIVLALLPVGVGLAFLLAPWFSQIVFAGDARLWLDGQRGGAAGGWFLLFLPVCVLFNTAVMAGWISPWLRRVSRDWSPARCATGDAVRFLAGCLVTIALAGLLAGMLTWLGLDPRGSLVGTYAQRNALVVGFVMGFAVIPIIYTIAEDALATVPEHLRSASLGTGATVWQTATRVVIPTAMSGLFSAVMVGLGRAVGETMIVLMAAGNTPVTDWNVFNGFRTLSANIAVELAEAARDTTHYRTLFLAALALFALTFLLNTVAEVVRLRFRRRAFEL